MEAIGGTFATLGVLLLLSLILGEGLSALGVKVPAVKGRRALAAGLTGVVLLGAGIAMVWPRPPDSGGGGADGTTDTTGPGTTDSPATETTAPTTVDTTAKHQSILLALPESVEVGSRLPLAATATSGLPVDLTVVDGPCQIDRDELIGSAVGACRVRASQGGGDGWEAVSDDTSITVTLRSQTIDFMVGGPITIGQWWDLSATATSGLTVEFERVSGGCSWGENLRVFPTPAGEDCVIRASQVGDGTTWAAAPDVDRILEIVAPFDLVVTITDEPGTQEHVSIENVGGTTAQGVTLTIRVATGNCGISETKVTSFGDLAVEAEAGTSAPAPVNNCNSPNFPFPYTVEAEVSASSAGEDLTNNSATLTVNS